MNASVGNRNKLIRGQLYIKKVRKASEKTMKIGNGII
jgi:hypothetical protein